MSSPTQKQVDTFVSAFLDIAEHKQSFKTPGDDLTDQALRDFKDAFDKASKRAHLPADSVRELWARFGGSELTAKRRKAA
jgi:hypothetical protein